ncbi:BnaCnng49640D [Brassica napus]|uniref:non-specific serine/threonine protein kinase n=2 Tax=Brassica TaxID=3705 RepID=A0A078JHH6_BRANA|nr:BnaCnng49640D [Brassica napus]
MASSPESAPPPSNSSSSPSPPSPSPPPPTQEGSSPPPPDSTSPPAPQAPSPPDSSNNSPPPPASQGGGGNGGGNESPPSRGSPPSPPSRDGDNGGSRTSPSGDNGGSRSNNSPSSGGGSSTSGGGSGTNGGGGGGGINTNTAIIIGVLAGAGLLMIVLIIVCLRRRRKSKDSFDAESMKGNTIYTHMRLCLHQINNASQNYPNWHLNSQGQNQQPSGGWGGGGPSPPPPPRMPTSGDNSSLYSGPARPVLPPPPPTLALGFNKSTFTYQELADATGGFVDSNLLGQGGFGYVHKGVLPNGKEVAVKSLKSGSGQGEREFQAEVDIISRVHHRYLVSLVGYCIADGQRMLVYEFVPNNTLEYHLHGKNLPVMDFSTRMRIALGSAKGLAYLHEDCHPRIIHRDIKSANILLDFNFDAMVADFGLAKLTSDNYTHVSTRVMGTFGYLAPEYASSGKLTEKSDVFSYGVMLLELITGKRPVDSSSTMDDTLVDWARPIMVRALEEGNFNELADVRLEGNYNPQEMARMVTCAAASIRHSGRKRPKMSQIVRALEGEVSLDVLYEGVKPGHSNIYGTSGTSSDYSQTSYNADMKKFRQIALSSQDFQSSEEAVTEPDPFSHPLSVPLLPQILKLHKNPQIGDFSISLLFPNLTMLRLRTLLSLKSSFSSPSAATKTILAPFHSTSVLSEKSRKHFGSDRASKGGGGTTSESSKNSSSIRFTCTVKEKGRRTCAKKTVDKLLFHSGLNDPLQNEWNIGPNPLIRDRHMKKKSPPGRGKKPRDKKTKRWHREGNTDDDFEADATNKFENKWREAWTNQSQKSSYSYSRDSGFQWREGWSWTTQSQRSKAWNNDHCDEPLVVGSQSDRKALGLPLTGPLKLEDVKNAYRSSAKKWHPDTNQGTSKAEAQEKFKLCVEAYNSLCSALS